VNELLEHNDDRIFNMIKREKTTFQVGKKEVGVGQLVEQLGFDSPQLQTPIKELSGGQKRRFQLLRLLFTEPNVLILDEPTNDLDTDMLAAVEDLLDSWPGTLIVVSHDRYLLERVTDMQYALLGDGKVRHLPRGIDQFLELRKALRNLPEPTKPNTPAASANSLSGSERRNLEKELARIERALEKTKQLVETSNFEIAQADQSDYLKLATLSTNAQELQQKLDDLELEWLEVSEKLQD
jgi:ABC-type multidrug transport system ATPase subunit